MKPTLQPCHPGCEVQIGLGVEPCRHLIGVVAHPDQTVWDDCYGSIDIEAYTEEIRCQRPAGHDAGHDPDAVPVVWLDVGDVPELAYGRTYGFRARHRDVVEGVSPWSRGQLVRVSAPPAVQI